MIVAGIAFFQRCMKETDHVTTRVTPHKTALLIDADNVSHRILIPLFRALSVSHNLTLKRAYGDWSSEYLKKWKGDLNALAVEQIQSLHVSKKNNNATDFTLTIDAMDILHQCDIDEFVIVSGDSDFVPLITRLKQEGKRMTVAGCKQTSSELKNACCEFLLLHPEMKASDSGSESSLYATMGPAIKAAHNRMRFDDGWAYVSQVGSYLKQQDPLLYNPKLYGFKSFTLLIEAISDQFQIVRTGKPNVPHEVLFRPTDFS